MSSDEPGRLGAPSSAGVGVGSGVAATGGGVATGLADAAGSGAVADEAAAGFGAEGGFKLLNAACGICRRSEGVAPKMTRTKSARTTMAMSEGIHAEPRTVRCVFIKRDPILHKYPAIRKRPSPKSGTKAFSPARRGVTVPVPFMDSGAGEKEKTRRGYPRLRMWKLALPLLATGLLAWDAQAATIVLKNGATYAGVTILSRTAAALAVQTKFGDMTIPIQQVATIDGEPAVPPVRVAAPAPPAVNPVPPPAPASPGAASGAISPAPAAHGKAASPVPPPPPGAEPSAAPRLDGASSSGPPYSHDTRMDVLIAACAAAVCIWLVTLVLTQKELRVHSPRAVAWNILPLLAPIAGYLVFVVYRFFAAWRKRVVDKAKIPPPFFSMEEPTPADDASLKFVFENVAPQAPPEAADGEAGIETARRLLEEAVAARTSDVHVEPQENEYRVRFRIDGVLEERAVLGKLEGVRVVSALKALGKIDIAEKRKAQDGRFQTRIGNRDVDMRIATAASIYGEKMVIRILDRKGGIFGLAELGMSQEMIDTFNAAIHSRNGMILATGPTGAGKTSTLYAAISQLDRKRLNIMTIEDPVEYKLEGSTQIPVNVAAGVSYESGLRSILRQDPDVILVGEMRDAEAAKIAMRAALTGTLVFSSLHTQDALNTILRLEEMGVEPAQMGSALLMVIAQRLVRVLCEACREPYACEKEELFEIGIELPAGETIYRAKGCPECSQSGYLGRTGIFELLVLDDEMRQAVSRQAPQEEIIELARARNFTGYREAGAWKVLSGITTVEEVLATG